MQQLSVGREKRLDHTGPLEDRASILVVEDSAGLRENLVQALSMGGYEVESADNGLVALERVEKEPYDVVVTDIRMPEMDGLSLLDRVLEVRRDTAVILMTAFMTVESAVSSLKKGAYDYITKPFKIEQLLHTVQAALDKRKLKLENERLTKQLQELNRQLEEKVRLRTEQLEVSQKQLERNYLEIIKSFAVVLEERDAYTQGHSRRVTEYSIRIARELGLSDDQLKALRIGGALHDIGKIGIPEEALRKPTGLSPDEWRVMREHPDKGARMIEPLSFLSQERILIRHHHERYDGTGYPDGLSGDNIPLLARILSVADAFDAMTSSRSYRRRMSIRTSVERLLQARGTQFDPNVVDVFIDCLNKHGIVTMLDCIILAAGKGKRMGGDLPKVLVELNGKPLIGHVLDVVLKFGMRNIYVVVGHRAEEVEDYVSETYKSEYDDLNRIVFVRQDQQLGTAHAVSQVLPHLPLARNGIIILSGDTPLLTFDLVNRMIERQMSTESDLVVATACMDDPGSLGRIKRAEDGAVERIVEAADATPQERQINEINVGLYCLGPEREFLDLVKSVKSDNAQGEFYLTDAVNLFLDTGQQVVTCETKDQREALGINTAEELKLADAYIQKLDKSVAASWEC